MPPARPKAKQRRRAAGLPTERAMPIPAARENRLTTAPKPVKSTMSASTPATAWLGVSPPKPMSAMVPFTPALSTMAAKSGLASTSLTACPTSKVVHAMSKKPTAANTAATMPMMRALRMRGGY